MLAKGGMGFGQQLGQDEIERIVTSCAETKTTRSRVSETQVWGVPWSEEVFIQQMVQHGHPSTLQSCLPDVLMDAVKRHQDMSA